MLVELDEMKQYLRVDFLDDDSLIDTLLKTAHQLCMDVMRVTEEDALASCENAKTAVLYATAYLYEHREDADHKALTLTLRALLFGHRQEAF